MNHTLEFNIILEQLSNYALSVKAKEQALGLEPLLNIDQVRQKMRETTEAVQIIECLGAPPLASMKGLDEILALTVKGSMLIPEQFNIIKDFLHSCQRMKKYLDKEAVRTVELASYGESFCELKALSEQIEQAIRNGQVEDNASATLKYIRRKRENEQNNIKVKMETILRSKKEYLTDSYIVTRAGKLVLPVKKEYKSKVAGVVIETSGSGSTYFIEPDSVRKLQENLLLLKMEEENEIRKILYTLTRLVEENITGIKLNMEGMEILDFIFAKGKLSLSMKAIAVSFHTEHKIKIVQGRHPLLGEELCVPIDFSIGDNIKGIIITGPNTGGKTVALKTIGLLSLMAQSGLHVPVATGSVFSMHNNILCDIGDGQSITENLSTFSAHITTIIEIIKNSTEESLVLLDELGSGTDPAEGMGIAVAILEELKNKGCLFVATTHYPEIKEFARNTDNLTNACMEFDRENLQPLYKLQIGTAGESCALYIAERLGLPEQMLQRAYIAAYRNQGDKIKIAPQRDFVAMPIARETDSTLDAKRIEHTQQKIVKSQITKFNIGDSVMIYPYKVMGIVYKVVNEKGELIVQIKGRKQNVNHKRVKLITPASELYPENYDLTIVFDTVVNRKARHQMTKKHNPNLIVKYEEE